jgi:predicted TIM-barrel fold metal-dependent hydrolase
MQNKVSTSHSAAFSVDSHFHVFEAGQSVPDARYSPNYAAQFSQWQSAASEVGATHGVLVQTSFMGTDNSCLLKHLQQNPDTLRGVAVLAPSASYEQLLGLHAQGVRGIRLNFAGQSHDMSMWQAAKPLWDAMLRLGWHVELHTDTGALPAVLAVVPQNIPVVVDHFCRPEKASVHDETVQAVQSRVAASAQVYVKLSAAYRLQAGINPKELAALWLGELGENALLWGSDWPCTNFEAQADYAALHGELQDWLQSDTRLLGAVRSDNPLCLYWGVQ